MGCGGSKKDTFDPIDEPDPPDSPAKAAEAPAPAEPAPAPAPTPAAAPATAKAAERAPARVVTNPKHMTSRQLMKALEERGIAIPEGASRADLEALFPSSEAADGSSK